MKVRRIFYMMLLITSTVNAEPVSLTKAQQYAASFMSLHGNYGGVTNVTTTAAYAKTLQTTQSQNAGGMAEAEPAYYIFNADKAKSWVIVSGDDQMPQILGYSLDGSWPKDEDLVPTPLKNALQNYAEYVDALRSGVVGTSSAKGNETRTDGRGMPIVGPLLTTKWNQSYPFNKYAPECPETSFAARFRSHFPIGCVAVAVGQILNYWGQKTGKPVSPADHDTYATYVDLSRTKTPTDTIYYTLSSETKYDWKMMPDSIGIRPDTVNVMSQEEWEKEGEAVGILLRDVAYAMNMKWIKEGGGALAKYTTDMFTSVFGFSYDSRYVGTSGYGKMTDYIEIIKTNLDNGWPIIAGGYKEASGGHCFVYDGYDSNNYVHINWGWGGDCNAFFDLAYLKTNLFAPNAQHNSDYSYDEEIIFGIHPRNDGEMPGIDNSNIFLKDGGILCEGDQGIAMTLLKNRKLQDGTKAVSYLDKDNNRLYGTCSGATYHKSFGYDYDFRMDFVNIDNGSVISNVVRDTTTKQSSRSISGQILSTSHLNTSRFPDGTYVYNAAMREVLNGETSDWLNIENCDTFIISGRHIVMSPSSYRQYYHGKNCIHYCQDNDNNALFHVEFTKNPESIAAGDSMYILFEQQLVASQSLNIDTLTDKQVLLTLSVDGTAKTDTLLDETENIKDFLLMTKILGTAYNAASKKIPFKAGEEYSGKTLNLTFSWPALGVSMTNDIKVDAISGIEDVHSSWMKDGGSAPRSRTEGLSGSNSFYNLTGQRVSDSAKGIVIRNGKKVVK